FQGHFSGSPTGIPRVWDILQRYSTPFPDLKFRITEFDVNTEDEALQADYTRDLLTISFSHPQMEGVQHWGFWENAHWRPAAAMIRADWTEKPNATAFRELVYGDWWTDVSVQADAAGTTAGRGFKGRYAYDITYDGRTLTGT